MVWLAQSPFLHPLPHASLRGMTESTETALAPIPAPRHDGWTPARQAAFLRELAASHCVSAAARAVGMSRQSAYALRARLKGEPFDLAWQAALLCRFDVLAEAVIERAINGVEVPHYYQGELVGTSRRFDERAAVALLAIRERFHPQRRESWHLASSYRPDEFGALVDRVEDGPETWEEEQYLDAEYRRALAAQRAVEVEEDDDYGEED